MTKVFSLLFLCAALISCTTENKSKATQEPLLEDLDVIKTQIDGKYSELRLSCTLQGTVLDGEGAPTKKQTNKFMNIDILKDYAPQMSAESSFYFDGAQVELSWDLTPSITDEIELEIFGAESKNTYLIENTAYLESRIGYTISSDIEPSLAVEGLKRYSIYERVPVELMDLVIQSPSDHDLNLRISVNCLLDSKLAAAHSQEFKKIKE